MQVAPQDTLAKSITDSRIFIVPLLTQGCCSLCEDVGSVLVIPPFEECNREGIKRQGGMASMGKRNCER